MFGRAQAHRVIWRAIGCLLVLMATPSQAAQSSRQLNGADFLATCSKGDAESVAFCNGYVQAVFDGIHNPGAFICVPPGTARTKLIGEVVRTLRESSGLRDLNAASLVYAVLLKTFPCH